MPFERAASLQHGSGDGYGHGYGSQCPLSEQLRCNSYVAGAKLLGVTPQCPLSGQIGCNKCAVHRHVPG